MFSVKALLSLSYWPLTDYSTMWNSPTLSLTLRSTHMLLISSMYFCQCYHIHTHMHPFNVKVKPIWILLKQETVSSSGISWAICKSATRSRQITTPAPFPQFLQAGCPSCRPTNSVKALKALSVLPVHYNITAKCSKWLNKKILLKAMDSFPWLSSTFPWHVINSLTAVKLPDISRFFRKVVTLYSVISKSEVTV